MKKTHRILSLILFSTFLGGIKTPALFAAPLSSQVSIDAPEKTEISNTSKQKKYRERHWKIIAGGGSEQLNYSSESKLSDLKVIYSQPRKYFIIGGFDYTERFKQHAYSVTAGGGAFLKRNFIVSNEITVSEDDRITPRFMNTFRATAIAPHGFSFSLDYQFRFYKQSHSHKLAPQISWDINRWFGITARYSASFVSLDGKSSTQIDQSEGVRLTFTPIEDYLKFYVSYSRGEESFDPGFNITPRKFHSHYVGGGMEWFFADPVGIRVGAGYENRDNGQTVNSYNGSLFFWF